MSGTSSLLLRPSDRVRYQPDGSNGSTDTITFRAWDQTSGSAGAKVDTSTNGSTSAFSTATATSTIIVTNVNDAPVLSGANNFTTITEDQTTNGGDLVSALVSGKISDVDAGAVQGIAVTGVAATNGKWQYSTDAGTTWADVGAVSGTSALLLRSSDRLRYLPDGNNGSTDTVTFRAWDQTSGAAGTKVDTSANGGTSAFSTVTATSTITVTDVNDAPILSGANNFTPITEDQTTNGGDLVSALVSGKISDVDTGALQGIAVTGLTTTNGKWQYSIDAGTSWNDVGAVSGTSSLLLRSSDRLRYLPDGNNGSTDTVTFRAWDQTSGAAGTKVDTSTNGGTSAFSTATATSTITVTDVNDAPVLSGANNFTTITEDQTTNGGDFISTLVSGIWVNDVDTGAVQGIAVTGFTATNGKWQYSTDAGTTWTDVGAVSGTSSLLLRSTDKLRYLPDGNNGSTDTVTFRAWDQTSGAAGTKVDTSINGGTSAFSAATAISTINVTPVNDAPVLSGANNFTTITEDQTTNGGDPVSALVSGRISDVDTGAVQGIAMTGVAATNGKWQYSLDAGTTWTDVGAVSVASALLLRTTDMLRFVPDAMNGSTNTVTFRAWDQTSGSAGTKVDTSTNGGTTAFSTATVTSTINVTAVNDAPVNNVPGSQSTPADSPLTFSVATANPVWISDVDAGTDDVSFSLTVTNGTITLPGLPGIHGLTGSISLLNSHLDGLVFTPDPGYTGPASVQITTNDLGHNGIGGNQTDVDTISITVGSTLLAAGGQAPATLAAAPLSQADLQPIINEAIARWAAAGLSAQGVDVMAKATFIVTDLPGAELGLAGGGTIYVDRDAAGYGWFVDPTPTKDEEFAKLGSGDQLQAIDSRALDRMDLLSVVEHELGHLAGLKDLDWSDSGLMNGLLGKGIRRAATAKEVEAVFAGGDLLI